jgi:hypothetical protein
MSASVDSGGPAFGVKFTPGDVDANRTGWMTARQRYRLLVSDVGWWLAAIFLLALPVVAIEIAPLFLDFIKSAKTALLSVYAIGIGLWALYRAVYIGIDLVSGRVTSEATHLPVSAAMIEEHRTYCSLVTDAGVKLRFPGASFRGLNLDDLYRVYFTPVSRRLISFERIGPDYGYVQTLRC